MLMTFWLVSAIAFNVTGIIVLAIIAYKATYARSKEVTTKDNNIQNNNPTVGKVNGRLIFTPKQEIHED